MRKICTIFICIVFTLVNVTPSFAQTPSPTTKTSPLPTEKEADTLTNQINSLKDKIASRVAQLRLVEKKGFIGTVDARTGMQLTLIDQQNNKRLVDVDEITKFSSPDAKGTFGISDITKGSKVSVLGLYNKESRRTLARFVSVVTLPVYLNGAVSNINEDDFTLTVMDDKDKETIVDIETVTKTNAYTKEDNVAKSGFSKITIGNRIIIVGYPDKKEKERVTATRILVLPELPKNPQIHIPDRALPADASITPSTGNGKKLTPIN
jgi:hypothetical protein